MLAHRLAPAIALLVEIGGIAHAPDPAGEAVIGRAERRIAGSRNDHAVNLLVALEVAMEIAPQVMAVHFVVDALDLRHLGIADALAGEPAGESLEPAHHVEKLVQILGAEDAHARAAIGQQLDQPFRGQHLQGLAQGRARDAETLAEEALGNARAVGQAAFDDVVAQRRDQFAMKRGRGGSFRAAQRPLLTLMRIRKDLGHDALLIDAHPAVETFCGLLHPKRYCQSKK